MPKALLHTLALLREIQTERGGALVPLSAHGSIASMPSLEAQNATTHDNLTAAQKNSPQFWALLPERFFDSFAQRTAPDFRARHRPDQLMEWYMFNLEHPVHQMALGYMTADPHFSPAQMSALIHFVAALNYLTMLRDLGVIVYAKAEITPTDSSRLKHTAASYVARERLYMGLADDQVRQIMEGARNASATATAEMDALLRKIKDGYAKGVLASTPLPDWLDAFNREIAGLHAALTETIEKLTVQGQDLALSAMQGQALDSDIEHHLHVIRALPLFRGLSEATLRNLLKGARLTSVERGGAFLTQGEAVSRFYIVMDGWVKTTKTTADGQETVVQILGKRDALLDIGYINAPLSSVNGRAVTKCRLLTLSLPVLRDHASRNRELAQNLLTATTARLQRLVAQYEQITLRTAAQRVGWFLVNLHLETGLEGAPLKLPFDKALIASYLNIKPETFSRVLQQFRKEGFVIDKDQVILPAPHALCAYCDPEMALRCCRAEAANCAPIQTARRAEGR